MSNDMPAVYVAKINTPGYLPMSDETWAFDTAHEAWAYLASEREREEDGALESEAPGFEPAPYSITYDSLVRLAASTESQPGIVYGGTPGHDGEHDLGQAYTVTRVEHRDYPHYPGYLVDCAACEAKCWCADDPGTAQCVYGGEHA